MNMTLHCVYESNTLLQVIAGTRVYVEVCGRTFAEMHRHALRLEQTVVLVLAVALVLWRVGA